MNQLRLGAMVGAAGVATLLLALVSSLSAQASTAFTVRGIVDVKATTKTINVTATYATADIKDEVFEKNISYSLKNVKGEPAKVYKWVEKKLLTSSPVALRLGQEVVVKGKKSGTTFFADTVTINDRSFTITGEVREINKTNETITILISTSTYKQAGIKGTDIVMKYNSKTICKYKTSEIGCTEIESNNQKINVTGGVTGTENTYVLLTAQDRV